MRALYSTKHSAGAVNTAILILRLGFGILIVRHGYDKIANFSVLQHKFINFIHLGRVISLILAIFAEFFCGILVIVGLFTRLACIPIIIVFSVALFISNHGDFFHKGEAASLYLIGFVAILIIGPGKVSADKLTGK